MITICSSALTSGFLNLGSTDILDRIILCCWGGGSCVLEDVQQHLSLYPLDAGGIPPVVTIKYVYRHCQVFPGEQNCPWWRTTVLAELGFTFRSHVEKVGTQTRLVLCQQGKRGWMLEVTSSVFCVWLSKWNKAIFKFRMFQTVVASECLLFSAVSSL